MLVDASRTRHPAAPAEPRPRLEARLQRALAARLAVIVAAPGYGKTAALARMARLDPRPTRWWSCVPEEASAGLTRQVADVLAEARQPRLLLINRIDLLPAADLDGLLRCLARDLPSGWCAAVSSATDLHQPDLARLLADGDAAYLDERDLTFDEAEARAAARELGHTPLEADAAWQRASGWPLGVLTILDGREAWLADYFRFRLLDRLSPRLRGFVEATLVLETLTPELCRSVARSADGASLLADAMGAHTFVRQPPNEPPGYLPLFRSTLLELQRRQQPRQLARRADRVAQQLLKDGHPRTALRIACAGGGWSAALDLLRRIGPGAVAAGRAAELDEWIATFPRELITQEPWLMYFRGVALRLSGDYAAAAQLQEKARDAFLAAGILREGYAYTLAELGTLACLLHRPAEAEQLLGEARVALADTDDVHQAAVLCSLADAYVALNRLREADEASQEAVALTASDATSPIASIHVQALQRLALVRLREGQFASALDDVSRAIELGHGHSLDPETSITTSLILGAVRWVSGDLESAEELLSHISNLAASHGLNPLTSRIDVVRASVLADLGRLEEADQLFDATGQPAEMVDLARQAGLGVLRLLQDRIPEARAIFRELLEAASIVGDAAAVTRAKAALGVAALRTNQLSEAEQWLLDAARGFEQTGARYRLAGTQLHLADLYLTRNDALRCKRYLKLALEYGATAESYLFFLWLPATTGRLAVYALREGIQPEYVEAFCTRRLGATEVHEFLPLLAERNPPLQATAQRIVDALLARGGGAGIAALEECTDDALRLRLTRALVDGCLTARGLLLLRHQYRLTWAETSVFVEYYLTDLTAAVASLEPERRLVAQRLAISENTLRHHVTSVRQKLRLGSGRGTASVFIWALMTGIATWPPNNPAPMAALRQSQSWLRPGLRPSA